MINLTNFSRHQSTWGTRDVTTFRYGKHKTAIAQHWKFQRLTTSVVHASDVIGCRVYCGRTGLINDVLSS